MVGCLSCCHLSWVTVSTAGFEYVSYPRSFFLARIKTGVDCKPVPDSLVIDTSGITFKSDRGIQLPPTVSFTIRPRFGTGQAVVDHHTADVEESIVQQTGVGLDDRVSKRTRTEDNLL